MGASLFFRNRYWWYKSLYDDYMGRQVKLCFGMASFLWLPHYWYGVHLNRAVEENHAHKNYLVEYEPRRQRLTHNLVFEEFEMVLEEWAKLEKEFQKEEL